MSKQLKVPHGTARAERRSNMREFKRLQRERMDMIAASTFRYPLAHHRCEPKPHNPHLHDVAVVLDIGGGLARVTTYESTTTYPANVGCPTGRAKLYSYGSMRMGEALVLAARINEAN